MIEDLLWLSTVLGGISGLLILWNLFLFKRPDYPAVRMNQSISVLIPARNEQDNIDSAMESVLSSINVDYEIIVGDDNSTDRTVEIVDRYTEQHPQIALVKIRALPVGWIGKQHACHILSQHARHPFLLFMDADVRLNKNALSCIIEELQTNHLDLLSGFPSQTTASLGEKLIIPLIHFLLLGYLPLWGMQSTKFSAFGAACGQLIAVRRESYLKAGGHRALGHLMHDGLAMSRNFRKAGLCTDIFDATKLASCRMYSNWTQVWEGFSKNATEGLATTFGLPIWTLLLFGGHIMCFILVFLLFFDAGSPGLLEWALFLCFFSLAQRIILAYRLEQSYIGAMLHPLGILLLLSIQWSAYVSSLTGGRTQWRGRTY